MTPVLVKHMDLKRVQFNERRAPAALMFCLLCSSSQRLSLASFCACSFFLIASGLMVGE